MSGWIAFGVYVLVAVASFVYFARWLYREDFTASDSLCFGFLGALIWPLIWPCIAAYHFNKRVRPLRWIIPQAHADQQRERDADDLLARAKQLLDDADTIGGDTGKGLRDLAADLDRQARDKMERP